MFRRAFLLAAVAAIGAIAMPVSGDEPKPDTKKIELKSVVVENGFVGDVKDVTKLPGEFRLVAEQLGHKKATYKIEGTRLKVGIMLADIRRGVELEKLEFKSDCPDNSQYNVETILTKRDPALKATTTAWTRHRHNAPDAKLLALNIGQAVSNKRNFDVQLKLTQVSFLDRKFIE